MGRRPELLLLLCLLAAPLSAQAPKNSSQASSKPQPHRPASTLDPGSVSNGIYRNATFGFSYKIPFGWVERTDQMQDGREEGKSATLLAVFERPPEAAGETINSTVIIAAESVASYPGLKNPADYFGPLTEVAAANGLKVENQPYESSAGGKQLARADFSKQAGNVTMYQSSLVAVSKGYVLSFTFIGADQDDVDELIENLSFATGKSVSR